MKRAHFHHLYDLQIKIQNSKTIKPEEIPLVHSYKISGSYKSKDKKDMPWTCSKTHEEIGLSG